MPGSKAGNKDKKNNAENTRDITMLTVVQVL